MSSQSVVAGGAPLRPLFNVEIRDYAHVPHAAVTRALAEVQAIFDRAGVDVVVTLERRSRSERRVAPEGVAARDPIIVNIYPNVVDNVIVGDPTVLGVVPGAGTGGRLVYVFSGRVDHLARRNDADSGRLLGIVLSHEIGHVLLAGRPHSPTGLMQPTCDRRQIRQAMQGVVAFSTEEAATLRAALF